MKLYHGTTVSDLEFLHANSLDRTGSRVLYLTDSFSYSLFYIRDRDIDFVTCGVGSDSIIHYDEKFPNQLEVMYRGISGWIYEVETDAERTNINGIWVATGDVKITGKTYIPDVCEAIRSECKKGNIELLSFEETTEEQRALNQEGAVRAFLSGRKIHPKREAFLRTHFPEAWEEAQRRKS